LDSLFDDVLVLGNCALLHIIATCTVHQKGKTNLDLLEQEIVIGSGISWAICKFTPCSRQITLPALHHSVFYRPDALSAHPANSVKALKAKKRMEYEVGGSKPRSSSKRTWREVVQKDGQAHNLNREDAVLRTRWRKLTKDG